MSSTFPPTISAGKRLPRRRRAGNGGAPSGARRRRVAAAILLCAGLALLPSPPVRAATCAGDCNDDAVVTVDELIRGVNIALGTLTVDACEPFDTSGDLLVTVDEIVAAVTRALSGCPVGMTPPSTQTPTHTPIRPATLTPTATASPAVSGPVRVLLSTGDFVGTPPRRVTSLSQPVLSPDGVALVVGALADGPSERGVLLRLDGDGAHTLLEEGQPVADSGQIVRGIGQPNAKSNGAFALVDTNIGAVVLHIDGGGQVRSVLGVGASGSRADLEPSRYVVSPTESTLLADAFVPGFSRGLVLVELEGDAAPTTLVNIGDELPFTDFGGAPVSGTVTDIDREVGIAATGAGATGYVVVEDAIGIYLDFGFGPDAMVDRRAVLVEGNQAPGLPAGVRIERFDSGLMTGGTGGFDARGFGTFLSGTGIGGSNDYAAIVTDAEYDALAVIQTGDDVPGIPGGTIATVSLPTMGTTGAILSIVQQGPGELERQVLLYVPNDGPIPAPIVSAGVAAPGGGVFEEFSVAVLTDGGQVVFRADLADGTSGYYAVAVAEANAPIRRLVGLDDEVALPGGRSAKVTNLGTIQRTAGLGGEAGAVGLTHFAVSATLDREQQAVLLVEIGG